LTVRKTSVVSGLVSRGVSVRLSEAASRYCLSASELVAAAVESLVANLDAVEERVRYYGCDEGAWRTAISSLLSAGSVLYEFLSPILAKLRGDGVLVPTGMSLSEKLDGFTVQFASLDPWIDVVVLRVSPRGIEASYSFIIGTPELVPGFEDVVRRLSSIAMHEMSVERSGNEARLTYKLSANSVDLLKGIDEVSSRFAEVLRKASVEWLVAEVEHGYSPEKHFELAKMFWEHGRRVESLYEKSVNYLRCSEELVKGLVKRESLDDIIEAAVTGLWTPRLLDESVERLKGRYPKLAGLWEVVDEVSIALQEARLQREEVEKLEARLESFLATLG